MTTENQTIYREYHLKALSGNEGQLRFNFQGEPGVVANVDKLRGAFGPEHSAAVLQNFLTAFLIPHGGGKVSVSGYGTELAPWKIIAPEGLSVTGTADYHFNTLPALPPQPAAQPPDLADERKAARDWPPDTAAPDFPNPYEGGLTALTNALMPYAVAALTNHLLNRPREAAEQGVELATFSRLLMDEINGNRPLKKRFMEASPGGYETICISLLQAVGFHPDKPGKTARCKPERKYVIALSKAETLRNTLMDFAIAGAIDAGGLANLQQAIRQANELDGAKGAERGYQGLGESGLDAIDNMGPPVFIDGLNINRPGHAYALGYSFTNGKPDGGEAVTIRGLTIKANGATEGVYDDPYAPEGQDADGASA